MDQIWIRWVQYRGLRNAWMQDMGIFGGIWKESAEEWGKIVYDIKKYEEIVRDIMKILCDSKEKCMKKEQVDEVGVVEQRLEQVDEKRERGIPVWLQD